MKKPHSCLNRTDNSRTDYRYDQDDNLIGWKEVENGKTAFEVKQIAPNTTKLIFAPTEEYFAEIEYDIKKLNQPQITGVKIQHDKNSSIDRPTKLYNVSYERNAFGRIDKKTANQATFNYAYETLGSKEILKGINYSRSDEQEMPMAGGGERKIKTKFEETNAYYSNGLLKQNSLNYYRSTQTGTMTPVEQNGSNIKTFAYDNLHRITKEINSALGLDRTFNYYPDGRLKEILDLRTGVGNKRYFYDSRGRLESINNSIHFTYDNYGNRTQKYDGSSTVYQYNHGGILVKAGNTTYSYNADGVRCKKERNGAQTRYYLDGDKILGEDRPDCKLRYFYDINGLALIRHIKGNYTYDYEVVLDSMGNVAMLVEVEEGHFGCRYEYDIFGKCHVLSLNGDRITSDNSIGLINPFRWKGFYYDSETGFYYANGSYYDPETGLYVDAAPITAVVENAFTTRCIDRNGILCDNTLELAGSPFAIFNTKNLSMDPSYDPGQTWWEKALKDVSDWWDSIPNWEKIAAGIILIAASIALAVVTEGASIGPEAELLGNASATAALAAAAQTALVELSAGIGFAVAFWALNAALTGNWDVNALENDIADAIFFTGLFIFISTSIDAIKDLCRSDPYPIPELKECAGYCFIAGTLVHCENGLKKIEDVQIGDKVLAYNEETGEQAYKTVLHLFRNESKDWTGITVNDNEIVSTPGHKYYLPLLKQWISAQDLKVGNTVLLSNGQLAKVQSTRSIHYDTPQTTYNFEVEDFHTYYVETGVLVHNQNCGFNDNQKALIELAKENKAGVTREQGKILVDWAKEYGLNNHGPMIHPGRQGIWSQTEHIKIFKYHIRIIQ